MQFLSGVGGLGITPVNPEYVVAMLNAQIARQSARLKANVDESRLPPVDAASRALEQRLIEQMAARKSAAAQSKNKNKKLAIGAVVALGAAFLLLQK